MKTPKTDLQIFLEFCASKGVQPTLKEGSTTIYVLPPTVLSMTYFGLTIQPPELTVYFGEDDAWIGGTNWLWDERLPWIASKRKRQRKRATYPSDARP